MIRSVREILILLVCVALAAPVFLQGQSQRRVIQNIPYYSGPGSDPAHKLDLYLPEGKSNTPLVFFVHGGAWRGGDKSPEGLVNFLELFLSRGIAVASANYRVSPAVKHPVHIQDVARAFAWVHRNAADYSLDSDNFFIAGHSAGGHLVALLGTDPRFLQEEGVSLKAIRGVIASSGVYDMLNRRGPGMNLTTRREPFGEDREALKDASPAWKVEQAGPETPPFLITYTEDDLFGFAEQAKSFYGLLLNRRLPAHLVQIPARTHADVLSLIGKRTVVDDANDQAVIEVEDLLGPAMLWFVDGVQDGSFASSFYAVWPEGGPRGVSRLPPPAMKVIKDVQYYDGPGSDPKLNALDLYLPEGESDVPILFEVHGGRWRVGDKGNPETLVNLLGRLGWGVVSTNYRLSPHVKHPTHVQDVARAFAWVYKNASQYGIDRERIVITGHSAGGHLVSLLALDTRYLEAEGVPAGAIRGAIPTSGIYNLPKWPEPGQVPTGTEQGFGTDVKTLRDASPINHINPNAPPFLITFTDHDLYLLPEQAHEFYNAFAQAGLPVRLVRIPDRYHCCPSNYMTGLGQPAMNLVNDILGVELVHFLTQVIGSGRAAPNKIVVSPQMNAPLATTYGNAVAISPDGRDIFYVAVRDGEQELYRYSVKEKNIQAVPGSEGVRTSPFFSPDGRFMAFSVNGQLKKASLAGGMPVLVTDTPSFWGASWIEDTILYGGNLSPRTLGLHRVSSAGGTPQTLILADAEEGETTFAFPQILPDGEKILFSVLGRDAWHTEILSPDTGQRKLVLEAARQARYLPTGHLVYEKSGTGILMAVPFDPKTLEPKGDPVAVLEGVRHHPTAGVNYSFSDEGTLVYIPRPRHDQKLVWVDRRGRETPVLQQSIALETPRLSPQGTRIALTLAEADRSNVWIYDLKEDTLRRLTDGALDTTPVWTPDGQGIIFQSRRGGEYGLYRQAADGNGTAEPMTVPTRMAQIPGSFAPYGNVMSFRSRRTIWMLSMEDKESQALVTTPPGFFCCSTFSPDGRWFAYVSPETNQSQVYVNSYPKPGVKIMVSGLEGGEQPVWSPTGSELFYRSGNKMMSVSIGSGPTFEAGKPEILFEGSYVLDPHISAIPYYDVSSDGQRFLMIRDDTEPNQIHVISNWVEELERLVPTH